ncbi:DegT/DnrJ/EryC1/StrS family aminotransferase [Paenibacillus sp. GCM10027628]|uniref:DegT/DnrJ/EryC1/StrS family aminotransferase n=1 Tax=Paenibacillus sp. GCM10027628 TaxID=3273413 RepID=UPI00364122A3
MGVLFSAPQQEFEIIREEWLESVYEIAAHGVFVGGTAVTHFEKDFAQYSGALGSVGLGNGTDALFLALKALGIGPGDEVITTANTFIATVEAIHHTGALPVLVDCDPTNYLIDLNQVKKSVTSRTKAIIPVHLYGQMVDLEALTSWANERGIHIVEDSAQAAGARLNGKSAGSIGTMGCFSFYPDKNLGALGDGGAITSSSPELLTQLRMLKNHGGEVRYQHDIPGFNSRLDPIQASALRIKLRYLDEWSVIRRRVAAQYSTYLGRTGSIILPKHRMDESHVFHLFVVRVDKEARDPLRKHLQKKGILTSIQYPLPVHLTPAFSYLGYDPGSFPVAELYAEQIISLPMHIAMSEEAVAMITNEITAFLGTGQV